MNISIQNGTCPVCMVVDFTNTFETTNRSYHSIYWWYPRVTAYSTHHKRIQLVHLQVFVERQPSIGKWIEPVSSTTPNVPGLETKQPGDLGKIMGSNRISSMNTRKYYQNYNDDHGESYHFSELGWFDGDIGTSPAKCGFNCGRYGESKLAGEFFKVWDLEPILAWGFWSIAGFGPWNMEISKSSTPDCGIAGKHRSDSKLGTTWQILPGNQGLVAQSKCAQGPDKGLEDWAGVHCFQATLWPQCCGPSMASCSTWRPRFLGLQPIIGEVQPEILSVTTLFAPATKTFKKGALQSGEDTRTYQN